MIKSGAFVVGSVGSTRMRDLNIGDVAEVTSGDNAGTLIIKCQDDTCQMLNHHDRWSTCSLNGLSVRKLTEGEIIEIK